MPEGENPPPLRAQRPRSVRWRVTLGFMVAFALMLSLAWPFLESAALLMDMTGAAPSVRPWLPIRMRSVTTRDLVIPTRHGDNPARVYRPASGNGGPTLVVFPGVHGGGIDEPRLVALSRRIAASNAVVVSAPLPDLRRYTLTPRATDMAEDAIAWVAGNPELAPAGRVGVVGVSFAGGLALVAAGRATVAGRITAVFAMGAHADLPRVIRYLCLADGAPKTLPPPHDYGVALMLRSSAHLVVPAAQVAALDRAIVTFLDASSAESTDRALAEKLFADARSAEAAMPEPSRGLMNAVNRRDVASLGRLLAPFAEQIGGDPSLSPARSPAANVPVFLLHGTTDNVIPPAELDALTEHLKADGNQAVDALRTPLLTHAEAKQDTRARDAWRLVRFWTRLWAGFERPQR